MEHPQWMCLLVDYVLLVLLKHYFFHLHLYENFEVSKSFPNLTLEQPILISAMAG